MKTRIKYWRIRRVLTQQELATQAGVSNQTIVNIERYGRTPNVSTLRKLAKALNLDPSELMTDDSSQSDGLSKPDEEERKRRKRPAA